MSDKVEFSQDPIDWILRSAMDYETAKHLSETMFPMPVEVICGLCQQCAEKSVKAVYLALDDYNQPYPQVHDIRFLLNQIKRYVQFDKKLITYGAYLTPFKIQQSYPSNIEIDEVMMKKGLEYSKEIHE